MNKPRSTVLRLFPLLLLLAVLVPALSPLAAQEAAPERIYALDESIPVDPRITVGALPNGLRYWIRENREPRNRAELRLVVNAGSVLEDEDQRGLAHVVEHLAFNGSTHFPQQKLVEFMESIGMRFGSDLNAFTSFDETLYMLKVPTDSPDIMAKAFLVLEDWAHNLTFDPKAIDKERGIIVEEWRLGQGADARMRDAQLPILLRGSRYAERLPDGKKEVIETFAHDTLKRYYRTWYRPDLMAVVAVGDFDKAKIEALVKKHFGPLAAPPDAKPRPVYPIPDHDETLYAIAADKEAARLSIEAGESRWLAFVAPDPLPADAAITVTVGPGTPSAEGPLVTQAAQSYEFRTYAPLRIERHGCLVGQRTQQRQVAAGIFRARTFRPQGQ